ncbi:DUF6922 domain-containing protein [Pedobacter jeongneungensis]|uniref:DUF6922 domain-containing protein n=1 Tax=Pedobacter jeongneungensis TaxID=947309 RepID=UPI000469927A|nr:hypothetical protein [Pedobacter jeongneungensis]
MVKGVNKRVIVVQWKRFGGNEFDVFTSLKGFCESFPSYNYNTLNNYLSKRKIPFENDEVKIERLPLITKVKKPDLPKTLFWDFDFEKIDWRRSYKTVIERVLDKGSLVEWGEIIRFYGIENILYSLKNEINYLSDITVDEVCKYFHLTEDELKCYTRKQLKQEHWI